MKAAKLCNSYDEILALGWRFIASCPVGFIVNISPEPTT